MDKKKLLEQKLKLFLEENVPKDKDLWNKVLAITRGDQSYFTHNGERIEGPNDGEGFDVYPSAYANGWAAKKYKELGGKWKSMEEAVIREQSDLEFQVSAMEKLLNQGAPGGSEDMFLNMMYDSLNGSHEEKLRVIFNSEVLDGYEYKEKYKELTEMALPSPNVGHYDVYGLEDEDLGKPHQMRRTLRKRDANTRLDLISLMNKYRIEKAEVISAQSGRITVKTLNGQEFFVADNDFNSSMEGVEGYVVIDGNMARGFLVPDLSIIPESFQLFVKQTLNEELSDRKKKYYKFINNMNLDPTGEGINAWILAHHDFDDPDPEMWDYNPYDSSEWPENEKWSEFANGWNAAEEENMGLKDLIGGSLNEDLDQWFDEKWVDISKTNDDGSHPECGRDAADNPEAYPKCLPKKKADKLSKDEKERLVRRKRRKEKDDKSPEYVSSDPSDQRKKNENLYREFFSDLLK